MEQSLILTADQLTDCSPGRVQTSVMGRVMAANYLALALWVFREPMEGRRLG